MAPHKIATLYKSARRAQNRLADWMRDHFADLRAELGNGRIDWRATRQIVDALGLTDEHGQTPSADTLTRTWRRVRRQVAVKSEPTRAGSAPLKPDEIAPGVRRATAAETTQALRASAPHIDVRPARPRQEDALAGQNPSQAPPSTDAATMAGRDADDAEDQIRAVLAQMGAARVPMPRAVAQFPPRAEPTKTVRSA